MKRGTANSDSPHPGWLSGAALGLAVALVLARGTMLEILRDPFQVSPGTGGVPRGPGPAAGLVLDLLCVLPALIVLIRRIVEPRWRLRFDVSHVMLGLLAAWTAASAMWASDRFAAAVNAAHFCAAAIVLWAVSQVVRSWKHLRLVAGFGLGLLLVLFAVSFIYRFVELPDLQRAFNHDRAAIFQERGWTEDSFPARQFAKKILGGDMAGFYASPNTLAATIVLLSILAAGLVFQRLADRDAVVFPILIGAAILVSPIIIYYTQSKAAYATLVLAALGLAGIARCGPWLWARANGVYFAGVALFAIGAVALVGHGIYHRGLPTDSLNFRWKYWVGSMRIFMQHPVRGVGWSNFGNAYLVVRLPEASEEIKDPHNFIVRSFVELGAIGGVLLIGWMLALWWRLTRPGENENVSETTPYVARPNTLLRTLLAIAAAATLINIAASVDFSQSSDFVIIELLKRLLYGGLFFGGAVLACARSVENLSDDDNRPAPWIRRAAILGIALFLVHNLIDFSMYEIGPMFLLMLLIGGVLGIQTTKGETEADELKLEEPPAGRIGVFAALGILSMGWIVALIVFVMPVIAAEQSAYGADEALRAGRAIEAAAGYAAAFDDVRYNADYAERAATALIVGRAPAARVISLLDASIAADPSLMASRLLRARFRLSLKQNDPSILSDYEAVLAANPFDVTTRLEYAEVLADTFKYPAQAAEQYRRALADDDRLDAAEPKRLSAGRRNEILSRMKSLSGGNTF